MISLTQSFAQPVKIDLNKKLLPKQKTVQIFIIDAQRFGKQKTKILLTSASRSAHGWQIGWHWLAGNSYFPSGRIFISSFSEPLGINIEGLNSLLLGIQLFI